MKYPRASGALSQAPDPMLKRVHFAHMMLLHTVSNLGLSRSGIPPDQILDPPLHSKHLKIIFQYLLIFISSYLPVIFPFPVALPLWFFSFPIALAAAEVPLMRSASVPTAIKADATGSSWEHCTGIQNHNTDVTCSNTTLYFLLACLHCINTLLPVSTQKRTGTHPHNPIIHNLIQDQYSSLPQCKESLCAKCKHQVCYTA